MNHWPFIEKGVKKAQKRVILSIKKTLPAKLSNVLDVIFYWIKLGFNLNDVVKF